MQLTIKMFMTSRAAQYCLAGRMQPVGRRLGGPDVDSLTETDFSAMNKYLLSQVTC